MSERSQLEDELARLCHIYLDAWRGRDETGKYLAIGMIVNQCGVIYRLAPPEGLMPIEDELQKIGRKLLEGRQ